MAGLIQSSPGSHITGEKMNPFKFKGPRQAPQLIPERVSNEEVIETYNRILNALMRAYQGLTGGDPSDTIQTIQLKAGEWLAKVGENNGIQKFMSKSLNGVYLKTFETMGPEVAESLGILKEYESEYSGLMKEAV